MPFNNLLDAVLKKLLFYVFPYTCLLYTSDAADE